MGLPRLKLVITAVALSAVAALPALAQAPKGRDRFKEADLAATSLMSECANIWASKDREYLKNVENGFLEAVQKKLLAHAKAQQEMKQAVQQAERELDTLNDTLVGASFGEAVAMEKAENKGLISKEQAAAKAAQILQVTVRAQRDAAEARLKSMREVLNGINRRMIGWFAYGVGVNECMRDQIAYLDKTNPLKPYQPPVAPPNAASIRKVQGAVRGSWQGTCRYNDINVPVNGAFSMNIDAQGNVTAAFVDGTAATVRGSMNPQGQINANGTVAMATDMTVRVTMNGQMFVAPDGYFRGNGRFTSSDTGLLCNGGWQAGG